MLYKQTKKKLWKRKHKNLKTNIPAEPPVQLNEKKKKYPENHETTFLLSLQIAEALRLASLIKHRPLYFSVQTRTSTRISWFIRLTCSFIEKRTSDVFPRLPLWIFWCNKNDILFYRGLLLIISFGSRPSRYEVFSRVTSRYVVISFFLLLLARLVLFPDLGGP